MVIDEAAKRLFIAEAEGGGKMKFLEGGNLDRGLFGNRRLKVVEQRLRWIAIRVQGGVTNMIRFSWRQFFSRRNLKIFGFSEN